MIASIIFCVADAIAKSLSANLIMVTVVSVPLLGEVVGIRRWAAVPVGLAGVLIVLRPGAGTFQPEGLYRGLGDILGRGADPDAQDGGHRSGGDDDVLVGPNWAEGC